MTKTVIQYDRYATLDVVEAIPDKRFKSGYRSRKTIATARVSLSERYDGANIERLRK
jgi:hypothetical protein